MLPKVETAKESYDSCSKKLFIVAEGFEKRSLYWISNSNNKTVFTNSIICRYSPSKKSRFEEMLGVVKEKTTNDPIILDYNRFAPTLFEQELKKKLQEFKDIQEVIIDISVMSKLLIMIILYSFKNYNGKITIIYSEPCEWGPSKDKFNKAIENKTRGQCIGLSSVGVGNVVRTPNLSSVIMQGCPIFLVSFLSFNEQLINVLVNEINPTKLYVINHRCVGAEWREEAMYKIHEDLINDFSNNDAKNNLNKYLNTFSLLEYEELFVDLAELYRLNCYDYRIVISPTGCKLHAISCALLKLCCPDVHIEYPTPESYLFDEYSSDEVANVYQLCFENFSEFLFKLGNEAKLNG